MSDAIPVFEDRLARHGHVTFRSWNGIAHRMDSDTELTFAPNGSVQMIEWGVGVSYYAGKYHTHPDGCIVAWFKDYGREWPVMTVLVNGDSLLLQPVNPYNEFEMGDRGGATTFAKWGAYWPFRMIVGEDEQKVLEDMKRGEQVDMSPQR